MNIFDTLTTNICIEKDISSNQVFSIFFHFFTVVFIVIYALLFFTTVNLRLKIMLLIYRYGKWPIVVRGREKRVTESSKKSMKSVTPA